jgi:hypothetical protein
MMKRLQTTMQGIVVTEELFEQGLLVGHRVWHFGSMLFSSNSNLFCHR